MNIFLWPRDYMTHITHTLYDAEQQFTEKIALDPVNSQYRREMAESVDALRAARLVICGILKMPTQPGEAGSETESQE